MVHNVCVTSILYGTKTEIKYEIKLNEICLRICAFSTHFAS